MKWRITTRKRGSFIPRVPDYYVATLEQRDDDGNITMTVCGGSGLTRYKARKDLIENLRVTWPEYAREVGA